MSIEEKAKREIEVKTARPGEKYESMSKKEDSRKRKEEERLRRSKETRGEDQTKPERTDLIVVRWLQPPDIRCREPETDGRWVACMNCHL